MTIQTTGNLSNSVRARYLSDYMKAARMVRLYDQFASPVGKSQAEFNRLAHGSSMIVPFISDMAPTTSDISETVDIVPQALRDATATITPVSRADGIQWSQELDLRSYTDYGAARFRAVARGLMESVEIVARQATLQGNNSISTVARASLDAGTATHNLTDDAMSEAEVLLNTLMTPGFVDPGFNNVPNWIALMAPAPYHDVRTSGNVVSIAQYQKAQIILNHELGLLGNFRLVVSPWAKVFGSAGLDAGSNAATTLSSAANALAVQIVVASATNVTSGDWLTIGTEETAGTHYPTNERVKISDAYVSGTTLDIIGSGANGGLRFDHASGVAVRNADSVYPVAYGGPSSVAKVYSSEVGEFGVPVGPLPQGIAHQFATLAYKWFGGYGLWSQSSILRGEYSTSLEA